MASRKNGATSSVVSGTLTSCDGTVPSDAEDSSVQEAKQVLKRAGITPLWGVVLADVGWLEQEKADKLVHANQIVQRNEKRKREEQHCAEKKQRLDTESGLLAMVQLVERMEKKSAGDPSDGRDELIRLANYLCDSGAVVINRKIQRLAHQMMGDYDQSPSQDECECDACDYERHCPGNDHTHLHTCMDVGIHEQRGGKKE